MAPEAAAQPRDGGADGLLSPSRELRFTALPDSGGVVRRRTHLDAPILTPAERRGLRSVAEEVRARLPRMPGIASGAPFDVELGFERGKGWLFQARPSVESRWAQSSAYLRSLDPSSPPTAWGDLDRSLASWR